MVAEQRGGMLVLRPHGMLDAVIVDTLGEIASTTNGPLVVDLDECTIGDPSLLWRLAPVKLGCGPEDVSIACGRSSARELLSTMRTAGVAVVQSVADALARYPAADVVSRETPGEANRSDRHRRDR